MDKLQELGESLLFEHVWKPTSGHIVDYKVEGGQLVVIVEKQSGKLVEGVYKENKIGRPPLKENRVKKSKVVKTKKKKVLTCPECGETTLPFDNKGKRICLDCKVAKKDVYFIP